MTSNIQVFELYLGSIKVKVTINRNCISGEMVSIRSWVQATEGQTKAYKIGICCFSTKRAALWNKSKDWLARNQDNVSRVEQHVYLWNVLSVS